MIIINKKITEIKKAYKEEKMLQKIIIIENDNKLQCDTQKEVVRVLLDKKYYELTEKEKLEKREIKAIANCINNKKEIVKEIEIDDENIEDKFIIKDEMTYILSLLITNKIMLLERIDSDIYTKTLNKSEIKDNYIIVNKFAKEILENYLKNIQRKK